MAAIARHTHRCTVCLGLYECGDPGCEPLRDELIGWCDDCLNAAGYAPPTRWDD